MTDYKKHLYMIVFPINALIASQLDPDEFGDHYTIGSTKHLGGKVIFAEIDINYRDPYFEIEKYLDLTIPHPDGSPKKTKFISSYNVLEYIDFDSIQRLFLVTYNGKVLSLESTDFQVNDGDSKIRIYQEITPLQTLIASNKNQSELGKFITTQMKPKGAPKICFTQISFDIDNFFESNKNKEIFHIELPEVNPYRFYDCITELIKKPEKNIKTISLGSLLKEISYKFLRYGIWFASGEELKFFPIPSLNELENNYFYWWKYVRWN